MEKAFGDRQKFENMNFEIKEATLDDVTAIQTLNKELFEHEFNEGFDDNLDLNWSFSEEGKAEITERITSKEQSCGFIVKMNNEPVGYLIGRILEDETGRADTRYADLEHMAVTAKYRGNNIGEKLVQEFKNWVKAKGLKIIKTNVSYKNEAAIRFYKKVGLIPADVTMVGKIE
jgi:ribosomal protein S18 acetylase RimI-like enzyme